jgi:geranylgeranyl reductase family protein
MVINKMYDVIVIGAGPGGSAAAKRCAEPGLRTLILEKKKLPRDKVCSGLLFSRSAKALVEEEFGELPQEVVLANLSGFIIWVPNVGQRKVIFDTPVTWRKDLDYWMNQRAKEKGVEIWEGTTVRKISAEGNQCRVTVRKEGVEQELEARFVVGADGTNSVTRKSLFPELKVTYNIAYRECYQGRLDLEEGFTYIVFPHQHYRPNFWIIPKGGEYFTLEGGLKELKGEIRDILADYGFRDPKPLWKDGCQGRALLFKQLSSGSFTPAKGNVLLVGDAAGLKIPVNGEGIHTAIKSGLLAANSIVEATRTGQAVSEIYIGQLSHLQATLTSCYAKVEEISAQASKGSQALLDMITMAFEESVELDF